MDITQACSPHFEKKNLSNFKKKTKNTGGKVKLQIPTQKTEKIVVALFSGILVNSGIQVKPGSRLHHSKC